MELRRQQTDQYRELSGQNLKDRWHSSALSIYPVVSSSNPVFLARFLMSDWELVRVGRIKPVPNLAEQDNIVLT